MSVFPLIFFDDSSFPIEIYPRNRLQTDLQTIRLKKLLNNLWHFRTNPFTRKISKSWNSRDKQSKYKNKIALNIFIRYFEQCNIFKLKNSNDFFFGKSWMTIVHQAALIFQSRSSSNNSVSRSLISHFLKVYFRGWVKKIKISMLNIKNFNESFINPYSFESLIDRIVQKSLLV